MARLNTTNAAKVSRSPIKSGSATTTTYEGGVGYERNSKGELFQLGVNLFAGENTFYETGKDRNARFAGLVEQVAIEDPAWIYGFLTWLRKEGNIRTASVIGAAHAVHARLSDPRSVANDKSDNGRGWNRRIVGEVCSRADEPGEFMAYWTTKFGKPIPQPVKRGISDASQRLYNEYSFQKYDTDSHAWRFGDVIEMAHIAPAKFFQKDLFGLAIASRHGNDFDHSLPMITANKKLREDAKTDPSVLLDPARIASAGMTWEDALSLAGNRVSKKELWEAVIDSMGYMALLRNLRNFEQAGISKGATGKVTATLSDPEKVAKSRQFPFRFLSAYKNAQGMAWGPALEEALDLSVKNIPDLNGRNLVLIDTSASMTSTMSDKSTLRRDEAAALFGLALALKNPGSTDVHGFANGHFRHDFKKGASLLRTLEAFNRRNGEVGHGTETVRAVRETYQGHDRVFIFSDMQAFADYGSYGSYNSRTVTDEVPADKYLYGFNLGGYKASFMPSGEGTRHEIGGLTDSSFKMVSLLERGRDQKWPWEN